MTHSQRARFEHVTQKLARESLPRSRSLKVGLAALVLAAVGVGCGRGQPPTNDLGLILQPTPDRTVDAIIRGLATPIVASPVPGTGVTLAPAPTTPPAPPAARSAPARAPG
jgi:hypothetical protein